MTTERTQRSTGTSPERRPPARRRGDPAPGASGWVYRNQMFGGTAAAHAPALATYGGKLWCMYVGTDGKLYYAQGTNQSWDKPKLVSAGGLGALDQPMLAELDGVLHAVYTESFDDSHDLIHCQYDPVADRWGQRVGLGQHSSKPVGLAAHKGRLFCVFTADRPGNVLLYTTWDKVNGWDVQRPLNEASWGTPALFDLDGRLHLLFAENDKARRIQELVYNDKDDGPGTWSRTGSPPPEAAEYGVNATSGANRGFMSFLEKDNSKGANVYVSHYAGEHWLNHENVQQESRDTPAVAVLNGTVNCAFVARNDKRVLLWAQRRLNEIPSDGWMDLLGDGVRMSALSVPGTHDTCASSVVPYVATQTMPVVEQLDAGIRFLDLRCRLYEDVLYMYHGSYPLRRTWSPTSWLTLPDVLGDIYGWLRDHPREALVVMIKQEQPTYSSSMDFDEAVWALTQDDSGFWYTGATTPTLKDVRRRMMVLRRYAAPTRPIGIDVSDSWVDNGSRFDIDTPAGVKLTVQDHYDLTGGRTLEDCVNAKWKDVEPLLDAAIAGTGGNKDRWYLNYTSAVAKDTYMAEPLPIAVGSRDAWLYTPGMNARLRDYLAKRRAARYGVVIMDFPESPADDLIQAIYESNFP